MNKIKNNETKSEFKKVATKKAAVKITETPSSDSQTKSKTRKSKEPKCANLPFKPASKAITAAIQKFFKETSEPLLCANYSFGKNSILRVLAVNGPEKFLNIDSNYYMFNSTDSSVKDFGRIFEVKLYSSVNIPWAN